MAGLSETRTMDALLTTTLSNYQKKLVDNIFDTYPFLSWANGKLGEAMRGTSIKKVLDGGESIVEPLLYESNSTAKSYAGAEQLDTTLQDGMTIARFNWKQYSATIGITGLEERANNGEAAIIRLLEAKTKQAEMSLRDKMSVDAHGDGTGNSSKVLTGLKALVDNTATVGGLNPSTFAWWKSTVTGSVGSFAANGLDKMRTIFNTLSLGNDKPDYIETDQTTFEYFEKALQPLERYTNTKAVNTGFQNITFKGVPVFFDRDCPSGYIYFLNSQYLSFIVHRDADFKTTPFMRPDNQDVTLAQILFQGNLTVNNRRRHGVLTGVTA